MFKARALSHTQKKNTHKQIHTHRETHDRTLELDAQVTQYCICTTRPNRRFGDSKYVLINLNSKHT